MPILLIRRGGFGIVSGVVTGVVTGAVAEVAVVVAEVVMVAEVVVVVKAFETILIGVISKRCPSGRGEETVSPSSRGGDEDENSSMTSYNKGFSLWHI